MASFIAVIEVFVLNVTVHIYLSNVHQRALLLERIAVCMNECTCECCDMSHGFY